MVKQDALDFGGMTEKNWAIFALRDIKSALDDDRYDVALCHINDAIAAIRARDDEDGAMDDRERLDGTARIRGRI